jgi:hypothetical protein
LRDRIRPLQRHDADAAGAVADAGVADAVDGFADALDDRGGAGLLVDGGLEVAVAQGVLTEVAVGAGDGVAAVEGDVAVAQAPGRPTWPQRVMSFGWPQRRVAEKIASTC